MKMTYRQEIRFGSNQKTFAPVGYKMGTGKTYRTNGNAECARRRMQIARGTLRAS